MNFRLLISITLVVTFTVPVFAEGEWEITRDSDQALERGLEWLAKNQGRDGNWSSNDVGLVGLGVLAFLANGHAPGRGRYGDVVQSALDYVVDNAKPSGLLNVSNSQRDMYNHGLATFVLGQAYGMTTTRDQRLHTTLDRALRLIQDVQCGDGGWDYRARRLGRGHDLSLVVMQAKALRSAADSGLDVSPEVIEAAIQSVRAHYWPKHGDRLASEAQLRVGPGQFAYSKGGGGETIAMAAAGVVCLQEFGKYDDWRIGKNLDVILAAIQELPEARRNGTLPFDAYTLYYVGQSIYQAGGPAWDENYATLRDYLILSQTLAPGDDAVHGSWRDNGANGGGKVGGKPGDLFGTAVACFVLAIPNRYLPILQKGGPQISQASSPREESR
ncbi:MAG: squalene--hopene cyclase [Planctomycetaceae bacterium]|nr:squalene--hopene cyclase [Planctomycetales bacterium]MCB9923522.1 squalene--hopene cyclase [Planctomycetaceae bacterium]